jgi:hypothetical protein
LKKYLPSFVCGFGAGVLQVVPVAKTFTCCLIIPAAAFLAIYLEKKSKSETVEIDLKKAAMIGLFTGLYAALFGSFFDLFITLVTKSNDIVAAFTEFQNLVINMPLDETLKNDVLDSMANVADEIKGTGFSILYSISVIINNFIVNPIFGVIGGLIGVKVLNSKNPNMRI